MQTRVSVRTRCEKSVWALDFALPREYLGRIEAEKKGDREREKERERQQNDSGRVRAFSPERKQKRVVERERARTSANADECG